jgi:hypothetical protein
MKIGINDTIPRCTLHLRMFVTICCADGGAAPAIATDS